MIHAITALTTGVELVTELLSAAVLLMALDKLATAIRLVYAAGAFTGRLLWPAIHLIATTLRQIDWRFALTVTFEGLIAVGLMVGLTLKWSHTSLIKLSERLGACFAAWTAGPRPMVVAPMVNPLAELADELELLTAAQLRELTGSRRRCAKRELVASWLAFA